MAGEAAISCKQIDTFRWWYLPSWLGLDAPAVVSTWTWAISETQGLTLSFRPAAAMFLTVWSIYLLDRIIDVSRCNDWSQATGRLLFGRRFRPLLLICYGCCILGILVLIMSGMPMEVIRRAIVVGLAWTVHFFVFVVPVFLGRKLPGKEFGVGIFFALGAYACLGYSPGMLPLLITVALLVAFNCLVIAARDAQSDRANDPGAASQWWKTLKRDLTWGGLMLTILLGLVAMLGGEIGFYISAAAAFSALTLLHSYSQRVTGDAVRALADLVLFTPVVILPTVQLAVVSIGSPLSDISQ